ADEERVLADQQRRQPRLEVDQNRLRAAAAEGQAVAEPVHALVGAHDGDDESVYRELERHRLGSRDGEDEALDVGNFHRQTPRASPPLRGSLAPRRTPPAWSSWMSWTAPPPPQGPSGSTRCPRSARARRVASVTRLSARMTSDCSTVAGSVPGKLNQRGVSSASGRDIPWSTRLVIVWAFHCVCWSPPGVPPTSHGRPSRQTRYAFSVCMVRLPGAMTLGWPSPRLKPRPARLLSVMP